MRSNANRLQDIRKKSNNRRSDSEENHEDYEDGLGSLRKKMLHHAKENRNLKKYKDSDS